MVMKRSSDSETLSKPKRIRSQREFDDNGVRDRLSSPESARDSGSPIRRSASLTRKIDVRTYKRSSNVNMRNENNYQNQRKRIDRESEPHIRLSNLPNNVGDQSVKQEIFHEFKKFGVAEITVHLSGRDDDRYGIVYFRNIDDAREARRAIERRGRLLLFERPVDYDFPERTSRRSYSPNEYPQNYSRPPSPTRRTQRNNPQFDLDRNRGDNDRKNYKSTGMFGQQNQIRPAEYIPPEDDPKATRTLFVGNLETGISSQELRRAFERFGAVLDVDIKRPARGQGNTYAFVKFADLDVAAKARVDMQGEIIGRNRVKIGYGKSQQTTRLWVGGLGQWTSIVELEREFDRFGAIRKIDYEKGDDHAYILYDSLDAASVAAREMRGFPLGGRDRRLKIDFADKDHLQDPRLRQPLTPPRTRINVENRVDDDLFAMDQGNRTYESDRVYDRKREPSPYRGREPLPTNESDYRNWREESNSFKHDLGRQHDLPPQRSFSSSSWPRDEQNVCVDDSDNWDKRSLDRNSRGQQRFRQRPPPMDDFPPNDHSPLPQREIDISRTRKRRPPSPLRNKEYRDNGSPPKRRKSPRTRSPSPNHTNHSRTTSPSDSHRGTSSLDTRFSRSRGDSLNSGNGTEHKRSSSNDPNDNKTPSDKEDSLKDIEPKESAEQGNENAITTGRETLQDLVKRFAVAWRGGLILKNSAFPVRMHFIGGNPEVADSLLRSDGSGSSQNSILRITQRLRLDQPKLEEVTRRINTAGASGHCLLLALPGVQTPLPDDPEFDEALQQRPLRNLMTYLKQKQAAAVVNLPVTPGNPATTKDDVGVLHAFPPCQFSHEHLVRIAPHLSPEPSKEDHLVILVIRGSG